MKKRILVTTTTQRYIAIDIPDEENFNELEEDLNILLEKEINEGVGLPSFDMLLDDIDLECYECVIMNEFEEKEMSIE